MTSSVVSASDWIKGIGLSVTASIIGGASKLAIRKSWVMIEGVSIPYDRTASDASKGSEEEERPNQDETQTKEGELSRPEQISMDSAFSSPSSSLVKSHGGRGKSPPAGARRRPSPSVSLSSALEMTNSQTARCNYVDKVATDAARRSLKPDLEMTATSEEDHYGNSCPPSPSKLPLIRNTASQHASHSTSSSLHRQSKLLRYSGMFGMTVLNPICCVWAMQYASPSILAPFSGLTLVWIVLFSDALIGERPQYMQVVAAGWIIAGEVIVAIFGDHTNETGSISSVQDVYKEYSSTGSMLYAVALAVWMIWIATVIRAQPMVQRAHPNLVRFAWGAAGGSITGLQNFVKDALTLLRIYTNGAANTAEDTILSLPFLFFVFAFGAIASSLSGLLLLTECMKRYDATYSSSMFVGSFVLSASFMAAARYHTFQNLDTLWNYIFYPVGLILLLIGIYILATVSDIREHDKAIEGRKMTGSQDRFSSSDSRITDDSSTSTMRGLLT